VLYKFYQKEETIMISRITNSVLAGIFLVLLLSTTVLAADKQLYGTWRLVSFKRTVLATGETTESFGKSPHGYINYDRDGRFLVMWVSEKRPKPTDLAKITDQERIELFKTMFAYGGTYTYDGKTLKQHIDISWNENFTGTDSDREVKFEGNRLIITTPATPGAIDGKLHIAVMTWERVH
jgi:Lipocalin-like domain